MKKRIWLVLLAAVLSLQCGCSSFLEKEYLSISDYDSKAEAPAAKAQPADSAKAEDLSPEQRLYNAMGLGKDSVLNAVATCLCILSALPLFLLTLLTENAFLVVCAVCLTLAMGGAGAHLFIRAGIPWESLLKLLQQGDYTRAAKRERSRLGALSAVYWLIVVAIFLAWGFHTDGWADAWIVWPIAGVLYGALAALLSALSSNKKKT